MTGRDQQQVVRIIAAIVLTLALLLLFPHTTDLYDQSLSWFVFLPIFLHGIVAALCSLWALLEENLTLSQGLLERSCLLQRPPPNVRA